MKRNFRLLFTRKLPIQILRDFRGNSGPGHQAGIRIWNPVAGKCVNIRQSSSLEFLHNNRVQVRLTVPYSTRHLSAIMQIPAGKAGITSDRRFPGEQHGIVHAQNARTTLHGTEINLYRCNCGSVYKQEGRLVQCESGFFHCFAELFLNRKSVIN